MEYVFKQLPPNSIKKEWIFIVLLGIVTLFANGVLFLANKQQWTEGVSIVILMLINIIVVGGGIALFIKKNLITKQIKLHPTSISVKEIIKNTVNQHNGNYQKVIEYLVTPDMIRCFRYISGSDEANRFEIITHHKNRKLVIPEPSFKTVEVEKYGLFISHLNNWLKVNNVSNCADLTK